MAGAVCFSFSGETVTTDFFALRRWDITDFVSREFAAPALFRGHRASLIGLRFGVITVPMFVLAIGCRGSNDMWPTGAFDTTPARDRVNAMSGSFRGVRRQREIQGEQTKRHSTQY